jgi:hypothetical protein
LATPNPITQTHQALVVTIQNGEGQPLAGLGCEVLSLDWGRAAGQPYGVIARGETDELGQVGFDLADWRRVGSYYLKVTTLQERSASLPLELTPGQSYLLRLVLTTKPDSNELQLTEAGKEASAAISRSNSVRAIPQATFLAQVVAQGRTRAASIPASSATQEAGQTSAVTPLPNTGEVGAGQATATSISSGNLGEATGLAIVGVVSLLAFVRYRKQIYWWLGLPGGQPPTFKRKPGANSSIRRLVKVEEEPNTNSVPRGKSKKAKQL